MSPCPPPTRPSPNPRPSPCARSTAPTGSPSPTSPPVPRPVRALVQGRGRRRPARAERDGRLDRGRRRPAQFTDGAAQGIRRRAASSSSPTTPRRKGRELAANPLRLAAVPLAPAGPPGHRDAAPPHGSAGTRPPPTSAPARTAPNSAPGPATSPRRSPRARNWSGPTTNWRPATRRASRCRCRRTGAATGSPPRRWSSGRAGENRLHDRLRYVRETDGERPRAARRPPGASSAGALSAVRRTGVRPVPAAYARADCVRPTADCVRTQTTRGLVPPRSVARRAGRTNRQPAGRVTAWDWPAAHLQYARSGAALRWSDGPLARSHLTRPAANHLPNHLPSRVLHTLGSRPDAAQPIFPGATISANRMCAGSRSS